MQPDKCSGENTYYHVLSPTGAMSVKAILFLCFHGVGVTSIDRHIGEFSLVLNECLFSSLRLQHSVPSEALFISLFGVVCLRVACVSLHLSSYLFTVFFIKPVERCAHRSFVYLPVWFTHMCIPIKFILLFMGESPFEELLTLLNCLFTTLRHLVCSLVEVVC